MNDNFQSMDDLLLHALADAKINYYAYALGRAKYEGPTEKTARLTMQLIFTQGPKWIELLQRLAIKDYELVFGVARESVMVFPTLINIAHPAANASQLREIEARVFDILEGNPSEIVWCGFVELVRYRIQQDEQQERINLLNRVVSAIDRNTRFVQGVEQIQDSQVEGTISSIYSITSYKVLLAVVKLYKECCRHFRKRMVYLESVARNSRLIEWIRKKYLFLFTNYQQEVDRRREVESEFRQDVLDCLRELRSFVEVEDIAIQSASRMVSLLEVWSIVPESQGDPEDQLNWEYGIILGHYGDDTPSHLSATINSLTFVPGFLKAYLTRLNQRSLPTNQVILRASVAHKAINKRRDLIEELLDPLMADIIKNFQPYTAGQNLNSQADFCRKLRLFLLFSGVLKESYFNKLIECSLDMLRKQDFNNFCFLQAINIMQQINNSSNRGELCLQRTATLTREKVPEIVNGLLNIIYQLYQQFPASVVSELREGKLNKILALLVQIMDKNEFVVERLGPQILKQFCLWATDEATCNWGRGIVTTPVLVQLIRTCKLCITLLNEDYYCSLQQEIYRLLHLLKHHLSRQFQEDLLEITIFVMQMEKKVSPLMCEILVNVQRIVQNSKSLYCIINLLKSLCNRHIAASIIDQWPDLCTFFFNLIANFIENVSVHYRSNYRNQYEEILVVFGQFLQAYQMYLESHAQMRNNLLRVLQTMDSDELQVQLFIIMDHQRSVHPYRFFHPSKIATFKRRNTFKMLYLYYCDSLMRSYSESTVNELLQIHKIQVEKRTKRAFESEVNADWPCLQMDTRTYLKQTLQQLKAQGKMDAMELSMTLRELDLIH